MKKRLISTILVLLMTVSLMPAQAFADEISAEDTVESEDAAVVTENMYEDEVTVESQTEEETDDQIQDEVSDENNATEDNAEEAITEETLNRFYGMTAEEIIACFASSEDIVSFYDSITAEEWDYIYYSGVMTEDDINALEEIFINAGILENKEEEMLDGGQDLTGCVAKVGTTGYETLSEAVENAVSGDTVVLIDDCEITAPIVIEDKNIKIVDDGNARTIYFSITDTASSNNYGRGLYTKSFGSLEIEGTQKGYISLLGHSEDGTTYNKGSMICVYSGLCSLKNVTVSEAKATGYYALIDNLSELILKDGTVISDNKTAAYKDSSSSRGTIFNRIGGVTYISGDVTVSGNYSNSNKSQNIIIQDAMSLVITGDITSGNTIGVKATGSGAFAVKENAGYTGDECFTNDNDTSSLAYYEPADGLLYWDNECPYYISFGNATENEDGYYTYPQIAVSTNATNVNSSLWGVSIRVDSGSFKIPTAYAPTYSIKAEDGNYKLATIKVNKTIADTTAKILANIKYYPEQKGNEQTVTIGFHKSAPASGEYYIAGGLYSYSEEATAWEESIHPAIPDSTVNEFLKAYFNKDGWIGYSNASGVWTDTDGNIISEGKCYDNFDENCSGTYAYLRCSDGKWDAASSETTMASYIFNKDYFAASAAHIIKAECDNTEVVTMAPVFDQDLTLDYYLKFDSEVIKNKSSDPKPYIEVTHYSADNSADKTDYNVDELEYDEKTGYYIMSVKVNPLYMNDDTVIEVFSDGVNSDGVIHGFNMRYWASTVIENYLGNRKDALGDKVSAKSYSVAKAMLNYGAAVQVQNGYNLDALANDGYEDTSDYTDPDSINVSGLDEEAEVALITDSTYSNAVSFEGNTYQVSLRELGKAIDADGTDISVNLAIKKTLSSDSASDSEKNTADKLYKLYLAINEYFGTYVPNATNASALVNTAYAYLAKSEYSNYDMKTLAPTSTTCANNRRQTNVSPEDMTELNEVYMDCSSFVYNVYRECFGNDAITDVTGLNVAKAFSTQTLLETATDPDYGICVALYQLSGCDDQEDYEEYPYTTTLDSWSDLSAAELKSILQPGDLIVGYRYADESTLTGKSTAHGHVVMWTGNGYIHCTGSSYDVETGVEAKEARALFFVPEEDFNDVSGYNLWSKDSARASAHLFVLRPLAAIDGNYSLTSSAQARQQSGPISVSKTANVNGQKLYDGQSVNPGDEITYEIKLENKILSGQSAMTRTVNVTDYAPSYTEEGTTYKTHHRWTNIVLAPGESRTLSYIYTVKASAPGILEENGGILSCADGGSAGASIDFAFRDIKVESKVESSVIDKFVEIATSDTYNGKTISGSGRTIALNIYKEALESETLDLTEYDDIIGPETSSNGVFYVESTVKANEDYLVSNFAGGCRVFSLDYYEGDFSSCNRVRCISSDNLKTGDLVITRNGNTGFTYTYFLMLENETMLKLERTGESQWYSSIVPAGGVLESLLSYDTFEVLRIFGRTDTEEYSGSDDNSSSDNVNDVSKKAGTEKCSVKWLDAEGKTLRTESYAYGSFAHYIYDLPQKEGYTFKSWSPALPYKVTEDTTFTPVFENNTYTLSFDLNGGTGEVPSMTLKYDDSSVVTVPEYSEDFKYEKDGFSFVQWNTSSDGTGDEYLPGDELYNLTAQKDGEVTLYAIWEWEYTDIILSLNKNFISLKCGDEEDLTYQITPSTISDEIKEIIDSGIQWKIEDASFTENDESNVMDLVDGTITAKNPGTAYVVVSYTQNGVNTSARCRVDVTKDEPGVTAVTLCETKVTSEYYSLNYATVDVLIKPYNETSDIKILSAEFPAEIADAKGNIKANPICDFFDIEVSDESDRTLVIVPKAPADVYAGKAKIASSYKSDVIVTLSDGQQYTATTEVKGVDTAQQLTLTVKKTVPSVKATAIKFNTLLKLESLVSDIAFTAPAEVEYITANDAKTKENTKAEESYTVDFDNMSVSCKTLSAKSASYYLKAKLEGYAIEVPVSLSLGVAKVKPTIKFTPASINIKPENSYTQTVSYAITSKNPEFTSENLRVSRILEGKTDVTNLNYVKATAIDDSTITIKAFQRDDGKAHTYTFYFMSKDDVESTNTLKVVSLAKATAIKSTVKASGKIDTTYPNSPIKLAISYSNFIPSDKTETEVTVTRLAKGSKVAENCDLFNITATGTNEYTLTQKEGTELLPGLYTYTATVKTYIVNGTAKTEISSASAKMTVSTTAKRANATVKLTCKNYIDVIRPDTSIIVTPKVTNLYGYSLSASDLTFKLNGVEIESSDNPFRVRLSADKASYIVSVKDASKIYHDKKYTVSTEIEGISSTYTALTVKQGSAKVNQSVKVMTLYKQDKYGAGYITLTPYDAKTTLRGIKSAELDAKSAAMFDLKNLGNGRYAIIFKDNDPTSVTAGTKSVTINVFLTGNNAVKQVKNASVSVKITVK